MPGPKPPEKGQQESYNARYKLTIGPCTGLDRSEDVSTIADSALVEAINARAHDGIVVARGGQSVPTTTAATGCIQGLIDIPTVGTKAVLAINTTTMNFYERSGMDSAPRIDLIPDGMTQGPDPYDSGGPFQCYAWWDGKIIFENAVDNALNEIILPEGSFDAADVEFEELFPLTVPGEGSPFAISSFLTMPQTGTVGSREPLYFGTMAGGVVGYANGQMLRLLPDATFSDGVLLFSFANQMYAIANQKLMRQGGWSNGGSPLAGQSGWSEIPFPAGTPTDFHPRCAAEWRGAAYIGGFEGVPISNSVETGYIMKLANVGNSPVLTAHLSGTLGGDPLKAFVSCASGFGDQIFFGFIANTPSGSTVQSYVATYNGGATPDTALATLTSWGESSADAPAIQASADRLYYTGWGSDSNSGFYQWDGAAETLLVQSPGGFSSDPTWWHFVLF